MSAIYLPRGIVVTILIPDLGDGKSRVEDFLGREYVVRSRDLHILSIPQYDGIC